MLREFLSKELNVEHCFSSFFSYIDNLLQSILFIKLFGIPAIILWILSFGIFCTLRLNFINIRFIKHAFLILIGKYNNSSSSKGIISHLQAFFTSVSGTIGLGTISGVAIAITTGGPGSIFWMAIVGILGMSIKFIEVTLAFKYRTTSKEDTHIFSGPFRYMKLGLAEIGMRNIGKNIAYIYAILLLIAMMFGGIPFQANQTVMIFHYLFDNSNNFIISTLLSLLVFIVIIGGIKRIAHITTIVTPLMSILYLIGCVTIILLNIEKLPYSLLTIYHGIWDISSITGGALGALIAGVRRSIFANEAGMGTAAIAHAAANDTEPVRAGFTAMLEPCVDTILISCLTGIVIIITGAHEQVTGTGDIMLASSAFLTISPIFGYLIFPFIVFCFAFSTILAYSYYCEVALSYLYKNHNKIIFQVFIILIVFISGSCKNVHSIASLSDTLFMCLTIPNAICIFLLSKIVKNEVKTYIKKYFYCK